MLLMNTYMLIELQVLLVNAYMLIDWDVVDEHIYVN